METIEQTLNGTVGFGNQVSSTLSRNGDLVTGAYISYVPFDLLNTTSTFEHDSTYGSGDHVNPNAEDSRNRDLQNSHLNYTLDFLLDY